MNTGNIDDTRASRAPPNMQPVIVPTDLELEVIETALALSLSEADCASFLREHFPEPIPDERVSALFDQFYRVMR